MTHLEPQPEPGTMPAGTRVVLFVCPHGAGKSRIAQACFDALGVDGWRAVSAGTHPQATVSVHAARLLADHPAAGWLDTGLPRPISAVPDPDLVVAIDCADPTVAGAIVWQLDHDEFDLPLRDELHERVVAFAAQLRAGLGPAEADR